MPLLTIKHLQDLKGVRKISFVQITTAEQVLAVADAGMDMIGIAFCGGTQKFPKLVADTHFFINCLLR